MTTGRLAAARTRSGAAAAAAGGAITPGLGDGTIDGLTVQQRLAAGSTRGHLFIQAGPGTGKTTVSAHRFGVQRFLPSARADDRAVVAVSFTRAATWNLRRRVHRIWGPTALAWPHRIVTLDTIMCDALHDLLRCGLLRWPDGNEQLDVHDSWAAFGGTQWNRTTYALRVAGDAVEIVTGYSRKPSARVPATVIVPLLHEGVCTHEDVRDVLTQALNDPGCRARVSSRLAATMRTLIVDEVYDANDLDIAVIEMAINAGVSVTLVGDPWQALYVFRGARPDLVPGLLSSTGVTTLELTQSFRWSSDTQRDLADRMRAGDPVSLPLDDNGGEASVDVVLSLFWKPNWLVGDYVLPLAFQAFRGGTEEAAATLLLNHVTRNIFSEDATYLRDALTALAINDPDIPRQLEPALQEIVDLLKAPGRGGLNTAYGRLVDLVREVSPRHLRPAHHAHTGRLEMIARRVAYAGRPIPGLTTHQAKGREWEAVGVRLTDGERATLSAGLSVHEDTHRKLYVACTRARSLTVGV